VPESIDALRKADPRKLPPDARQAKIQEAAKKIREEGDVSRRAFMSSAALGVGWFAFGAGTVISIGPAFGRFMMPNVLEEPDPRVRVGKLQRYVEMQPGDVNEDYKPQGIWMIRETDRVAALSIICTHLGCIPNWLPNDRKFKCPCHGSGYKPSGINFEGPTPRPLERFRITIEDGIVVVDKSKKFQYELGQWDTAGSFLTV
jgi:cytochrome b6-f complex iron-sulfur subunit